MKISHGIEIDLALDQLESSSEPIIFAKCTKPEYEEEISFKWGVDLKDIHKPNIDANDNANYINAGLKLHLLDGLISLYAGANSLFLENAENEFSFGGGITIPQILNNSLSVHFTHEQMKFLGNSQQISISFNY